MKEVIYTDCAPEPVGPYSQAIRANGFLFCSGQVGKLPKIEAAPLAGTARSEAARSSLEDQARQALNNLKAVLEAGGSSLDKVVKTTIFLTDMGHFGAVNKVYAEFFPESQSPPARATVAVRQLPNDVFFEIEAVAVA